MGGNHSTDVKDRSPNQHSWRKSSSKSDRTKRINDNYETLDQVKAALQEAGLESSNLIVAVDFTKSNEWKGRNSFEGKSLHSLDEFSLNPYEQVISIIGKTLSGFDEDDYIPCYGFGDVTTHDEAVFSFQQDNEPCDGFRDVLRAYREITPHVKLCGPTSFAPAIETAMDIVDKSGGKYHILLIIADGQITMTDDTSVSRTIKAIVKASEYPLSIICVGVGDGPWDTMTMFDDYVPARAFDNFQFVNFSSIMNETTSQSKEASFALAALMEIPAQFKAILNLGLLGKRKGVCYAKEPLPPPNKYYIGYP